MKPDHGTVPVFAVVGRVNMGKSAVLATLLEIDDNEIIRVSPTPGETTRCQPYPLVFGGVECVRFIDTPGFSRPVEAMREIQRLHGEGTPGPDALRSFLTEKGDAFRDERALLEPLLNGAGMLYVVDPSKPLRDDFLAEMEILRWTGCPRLALLNRRDAAPGADETAWRDRLGGTFNLTRSFDAHRARFPERLRLLRALLEIEERWRPQLERTLRLVEDEWESRREEVAEDIADYLAAALELRAVEPLDPRDDALAARRGRKERELADRYFRDLAALERKATARMLRIHRHHLLTAGDSGVFHEMDLQSAETWRKWGLSRMQLAAVGTVTGAGAGLAVDIATGGITHGAGTLFGAVGGGFGTWFMGGRLPELRMSVKDGLTLSTGTGRALETGPPLNPNFPWVLLDGALDRYRTMLARTHGRRDAATLAGEGASFAKGFSSARRALLGKWFAKRLKGTREPDLENKALAEITAILREIEQADDSGRPGK